MAGHERLREGNCSQNQIEQSDSSRSSVWSPSNDSRRMLFRLDLTRDKHLESLGLTPVGSLSQHGVSAVLERPELTIHRFITK